MHVSDETKKRLTLLDEVMPKNGPAALRRFLQKAPNVPETSETWLEGTKTIIVFISYSWREEEVKEIKQKKIIRGYCHKLWQLLRDRGFEVFYDEFSLPQKQYGCDELKKALREQVERCHLFTSFLSPCYIKSKWCRFECNAAVGKPPQAIQVIYWKKTVKCPTGLKAIDQKEPWLGWRNSRQEALDSLAALAALYPECVSAVQLWGNALSRNAGRTS